MEQGKSSIFLLFQSLRAVSAEQQWHTLHSSGQFRRSRCLLVKCGNTFVSRNSSWQTRGVVKEAQLVSVTPVYMVMSPEISHFSVLSNVKAVITVRRKLFMFFPQADSNMDFSVSSMRLCDVHQMRL